MAPQLKCLSILVALAASSSLASAQLAITRSTIDSGGGSLSGGAFTISATIGQHDATNTVSGGPFTLTGGFWIASVPSCPADFNNDGVVDFFDYLDFVAAFSSGDPGADFNDDAIIDFFDYLDFVAAFSMPC